MGGFVVMPGSDLHGMRRQRGGEHLRAWCLRR
jgi:hypothetical protein